ncbi:MAG TPA: AAA family ATPase [Chloroflexota bacterium]|jgi:transitional endoplasmic reticulum ATPase
MSIAARVDAQPSDYRDARLCAAYLDPAIMAAAGVQGGDALRVRTARGRQALVRLAGPHPAEGAGQIRFDRFTRQALKTFPHEPVTLEPVALPPASEVVLMPAIDVSLWHVPHLVRDLKAALVEQAAPLREGMLVYLRLPGRAAGVIYEVHSVSGDEGLVAAETQVYLAAEHDHEHGPDSHEHDHDGHAETVVDATFEDVGGLDEQIRAIREFVELPLLFPQVYQQLGIRPPRGVIFFGAPGTGKTLLARCVANEIHAQLFYVNGPEIVGTYSGQTEENLRRLFAEAALKPPSIIFVDELDAVAPARRTVSTLSEARAVTQLLALMDGLERAEGVMVIGTTNRVQAIDPALRRPGRFDKEVYFPTPSPAARAAILRVHTREMPLAPEAEAALPEVARQAHGFVGADLMELAREAGLSALRRAAQPFLASPSPASYPAAEDLVVTRDDLLAALQAVRPAALRESLLSYPTVGWDDVGGLARVKQRLRDLIERPLRQPELFAQAGLATSLGVLLYGPPGGGKTLLARALARESGLNLIAIQGSELFSQWFGESEQSIRQSFGVARRAAPCILFFDQLDAIAPLRLDAEADGTRAPQRVVNQLLSELDGMEPRGQVLVLGATNRLAMVDPAALRPGRFGVHVYVGLPNDADRADILRVHLRGATLAAGLAPDDLIAPLVPLTAGFSGADIAFLCQTAKLHALDAAAGGPPQLSAAHFPAALADLGERAGAEADAAKAAKWDGGNL